MLKKVVVAVAAAMACASVAQAAGNEWEVHGYGRLGGQWDGHFNNNMTTYAKNEYRTVTSNDENNNQLEVTISKKTKVKGGVWSNFVVRAEYGNQNAGDTSAFYSSQGSEHSGAQSGQFEVKEAYIELGGFDYLGADTKIWTGQRFLNRAQAVLSKEFWKQSSGVGFGFENGKFGAAIVSNDPGNTSGSSVKEKSTGQTITSLDVWYSGLEVPGGNLQFDLKYLNRAHTQDNQVGGVHTSNASNGIGGAVTYNTNWYGLKGWTQNAIGYGKGLATNRGVNVGSWSDGFGKDSKSIFVTSYGVADLTDKLQLASEVTVWQPKHVGWGGGNGDDTVTRSIIALQPSYKLNDFTRLILTGSFGYEKVKNNTGNIVQWYAAKPNAQLGSSEIGRFVAAEVAVAFTVNSDYFGRPQIKPFVSYVKANTAAANQIGLPGASERYWDGSGSAYRANASKNSEFAFGVEGEIWF